MSLTNLISVSAQAVERSCQLRIRNIRQVKSYVRLLLSANGCPLRRQKCKRSQKESGRAFTDKSSKNRATTGFSELILRCLSLGRLPLALNLEWGRTRPP